MSGVRALLSVRVPHSEGVDRKTSAIESLIYLSVRLHTHALLRLLTSVATLGTLLPNTACSAPFSSSSLPEFYCYCLYLPCLVDHPQPPLALIAARSHCHTPPPPPSSHLTPPQSSPRPALASPSPTKCPPPSSCSCPSSSSPSSKPPPSSPPPPSSHPHPPAPLSLHQRNSPPSTTPPPK